MARNLSGSDDGGKRRGGRRLTAHGSDPLAASSASTSSVWTPKQARSVRGIEAARSAMEQDPRSTEARGRFAMVCHAHDLFEEAAVAYRRAACRASRFEVLELVLQSRVLFRRQAGFMVGTTDSGRAPGLAPC